MLLLLSNSLAALHAFVVDKSANKSNNCVVDKLPPLVNMNKSAIKVKVSDISLLNKTNSSFCDFNILYASK